jgi:hypothetical protein
MIFPGNRSSDTMMISDNVDHITESILSLSEYRLCYNLLSNAQIVSSPIT